MKILVGHLTHVVTLCGVVLACLVGKLNCAVCWCNFGMEFLIYGLHSVHGIFLGNTPIIEGCALRGG